MTDCLIDWLAAAAATTTIHLADWSSAVPVMCCESRLIAPGSASHWPAMRSRRLASLSAVQSGKLITVSVSWVNNKMPAGCGRFQSWDGHQSSFFFFLSLIKTNQRTQQLGNNAEWLPEHWRLPPPPDERFQVQVWPCLLAATSSHQQPNWEKNELHIFWFAGRTSSQTQQVCPSVPFYLAAFGGFHA